MNPNEDHSAIHSMSKKAYLEYQRLFPNAIKEKMPAYTTLILTLSALIIFGIFAINPTIGTILELRKELDDAKIINQQLESKITNLNALADQYASLEPDLIYLTDAIPQDPQVAILLGKIQAIADETNVSLTRMELFQTPLLILYKDSSHNGTNLSVDVQGDYESLSSFIKELTRIDRLLLANSIEITRDSEEQTLIKLTTLLGAYFAK